MLKRRSYYKELGIQPDASITEIREAYRKLAKKYHPDVNSGDSRAEEKFKRINEAYRALLDPEARLIHHQDEAAATMSKASARARPASQFTDFFKQAFKSGFGATGQGFTHEPYQKGKDLQVTLEIDPLELAGGTSRQIKVKRQVLCAKCGGSGMQPGSQRVRCRICGGAGTTTRSQNGEMVIDTCSNCRGLGTVIRERCFVCGGKGIAPKTVQLTIEVPRETKPETVLTIIGKGDAGKGGAPYGDLKIKILTSVNDYFEMRGQDVIYEYPVTLKELVTGGEIDVPTPDQRRVKLTLQPGIQEGKLLRIRGRGIPGENGKSGDLLVRIRYHLPGNVNPRAERLLDELLSIRGWTPKKDKNGYYRK